MRDFSTSLYHRAAFKYICSAAYFRAVIEMLEPKKKCCCHVTAVHLFLIMKCVSRLVVDFFYELILLQNVFWYVIPLIVIFFFSFIGFHPYFLLISSSPVLHLCFLAWQQYPFLRVFVIKNLKWEITWPLTSNTRLNLFWRLSGNNQDWASILIARCSMPYLVQLSGRTVSWVFTDREREPGVF